MHISVMLHSFSAALSKGALSVADAIACCAEAGAEGIEPMAALVKDLPDGEVARLIEAHGLSVPCCDVSVDLLQDDPGGRREAAQALAEHVRQAARLGSPVALIVPGSLREGLEFAEGAARAADGIRSVLPLAAELGITLTVEQMGSPRALCRRGEHLRAIIDAVQSPHFGLTYDAGNFYITGEDPVRPLADLLPWVRHAHFKDIRLEGGGRWTSVPLGQGEVPLEAVYRILADGGYDGYISVEYEGPGDPRPAVQTGVEYLRRLMAG